MSFWFGSAGFANGFVREGRCYKCLFLGKWFATPGEEARQEFETRQRLSFWMLQLRERDVPV